jgi:sugar transferase (PEP-CTERM/EpsH1 system associated)
VNGAPAAAANGREAVPAPLIAHVIHRLDMGGMENGLVNLINGMPAERFRHVVICLTDHTDFRDRLRRADVPVYCLHKPPGNSPVTHLKLWRLLRRLRPDIAHTRNLSALECALSAAVAGVPLRLHSEHGRDVEDLDGRNPKHRLWRRLFRPFVHQYIALSKDLERYLHERVAVAPGRVWQLYNGVDTDLFRPARGAREPLPIPGFAGRDDFVVGTAGRMQPVKDPLTLARAFVRAVRQAPPGGPRLRLVMAGDGPLRGEVETVLEQAGVRSMAWLPGARNDVPAIMRGLDLFVLPSLNEGICNGVLEAMASGLPVVATAVGGNPELVQDGRTGMLVPPSDHVAISDAILDYCSDAAKRRRHAHEARAVAERCFGMAAMVGGYVAAYEALLARRGRKPAQAGSGGGA